MPTEQEYWEALQARICVKCVDGDTKGNCLIGRERECALKIFLPQILEVVNSVYSPFMMPYENLLRNKICAVCMHQNPSGGCTVRNEVECALDRYFPLVVEVIEELRQARRPMAG